MSKTTVAPKLTDREHQRQLRLMRGQILKSLDVARAVVEFAFRGLRSKRGRVRRRGKAVA